MDNAKQYFDFLEFLPERFDVDRISIKRSD